MFLDFLVSSCFFHIWLRAMALACSAGYTWPAALFAQAKSLTLNPMFQLQFAGKPEACDTKLHHAAAFSVQICTTSQYDEAQATPKRETWYKQSQHRHCPLQSAWYEPVPLASTGVPRVWSMGPWVGPWLPDVDMVPHFGKRREPKENVQTWAWYLSNYL